MRSIRILISALVVVTLMATFGVEAKGKKRRKGKNRAPATQAQVDIETPDEPKSFDVRAFLAGDSDEDGVLNAKDPCWTSPGGALQIHKGCAALDIIQMPESLAGTLPDAIKKATARMESTGGLASLVGRMEQILHLADEAVLSTRSGDACVGLDIFADVEIQLTSVEADVGLLVREADAGVGEPTDFQDDVRESEFEVSSMEYLQLLAGKARIAAADLMAATGAVCDVSVPGIVTRGVVSRIDDAKRRLYFQDGRTFALARGAVIGPIADGQAVIIEGTDFGDGTGIGTAFSLAKKAKIRSGPFFSCAQLRIAPIQPFSPVSTGPYILHDPIAYRYPSPFPGSTSVFRLEAGMRLGITDSCGGSQIQLSGDRYSVSLHLTYVAKDKGTIGVWLANDLHALMEPVPLPEDADPGFPATLTVTHRVEKCQFKFNQGFTCGSLKKLGQIQSTVRMVDRGGMCTAFYEKTLFDIEDREPGWLQRGKLQNIISFAVSDGGAQPGFLAQGYGVSTSNPPISTYPNHAFITGSPFAVHAHDIYPIFGGIDTNENLLLQAATGVDHAAGLIWPRILGFRNAKNYQYSCSLPQVVRDVVDFCPGKSHDSYYHMPFVRGETWTQGQGNLSDPGCTGQNCRTHGNGYAYDMVNGCGTKILAARAGRVTFVRESAQSQTGKWCCSGQPVCAGCAQSCCSQGASCPGNEIWLQHQDASFGRYVHMPKNGIIPEEGDVIRRGQELGTVGITGNTSSPHLHFGIKFDVPGTQLALFQAVDPGTATVPQPNLLHCYEPLEGQPIHSDNKLCTTCVPQ
jgi:murein DD-endopeptidase MepM/ murein hydrolase activator NlpD